MTYTRKIDAAGRNNRKRKIYYVILVLVVLLAVWRTAGHKNIGEIKIGTEVEESSKNVIIATTTSLQDSGLLDVLIPIFEKDSGYKVKIIAVGTGEALKMGKRQIADLILVHAPELEEKFMDSGFGERREEIMSSEFVVAGPSSDPADIRDKSFPEAFRRIARHQATFISRGDNSGTHFLEKKIWAESRIEPTGNWYYQTGQGMGESLRIASEKNAYILTDYPTFYRLVNRLDPEVLARDVRHQNIYSAITVQNLNGKINEAGAKALADFLISEQCQELIWDFGSEQTGCSGRADNAGMSNKKIRLFQPLRLERRNGKYVNQAGK